MKKRFLGLGILLALSHNVKAQQGGCTDPAANNFSAIATFNDGSCTYDATNIRLKKIATLPNELKEISGMAYWNGKLYGHQDSQSDITKNTEVYEFDETTGTITKTIRLEGVTNVDWEDMTQDETHFYIADVGNNVKGNRQDLKIYKFPKSLIADATEITIPRSEIGVINFSYEDQTDFTAKPTNKTSFDCEAVAYNRGILHLFTKNWIGNTTTHYTIPAEPGTYQAIKRDTFDTGTFKITGADFGAYDLLVLTGYEVAGFPSVAMFLSYGFDGTYFYFNTGNKRKLDVGGVSEYGQVEAVTMKNPFEGFMSNEYFYRKGKFFGIPYEVEVPQTLQSFNILDYIKRYYEHNPIDLNELSQPAEGTIRYNPNTHKFEGFDGTHWNPFGAISEE